MSLGEKQPLPRQFKLTWTAPFSHVPHEVSEEDEFSSTDGEITFQLKVHKTISQLLLLDFCGNNETFERTAGK